VPLSASTRPAAAVVVAVRAALAAKCVRDSPPHTRDVPLLARAPDEDERDAENHEPDHIV